MIISLYVPLGVACVIALVGPGAARRLAPAAATRVLSALAIACAAGTLGTLLLAIIGGGVNLAPLLGFGKDREWLVAGLDAVPWPLGIAALIVLVVVAVRIMITVFREHRTMMDLKALIDGHGGLLVLNDARPYAYAVPVGTGTVIVSTSMLSTLSDAERKALLAHERAHLNYRHHLHREIGDVAASINPLLGGMCREMRLQTERWADETAATHSTRTIAATSLTKATLASTWSPPAAMAYTTNYIRERLAALAIAPPISRWNTAMPIAAVALLGGIALTDALKACLTVLALFYP